MTIRPKIVVTIHGIRTRGVWQKEITPYLAQHGLIPYHIDYGWFNAIKFFFPWWREKQINSIRAEIRNLVSKVGTNRINIISHSFGTLIAIEILLKENGNIKYDRVVLTGSILPSDFNWVDLFSDEKKWVLAVFNYRATSDWVVSMAGWISHRLKWLTRLKAGNSGKEKFIQQSPFLLDHYIDGNHNEVHNPISYVQWARFIAYPFLPEDLLAKIRTLMQNLRVFAATTFNIDKVLIRVNFFAFIDGALRIVPGATDNMLYAPEFDLKIEPGHGGIGLAYSEPQSCIISIKRGNNWNYSLPVDELDKIAPSLSWVLSFPIESDSRKKVVGILNIDGLEVVPKVLENQNCNDCLSTLLALRAVILEPLQACLDKGFCGQQFDTY